MQSLLNVRVRCFGAHLLGARLKILMLNGSKPFTPQEEARYWEFLPSCKALRWVWDYGNRIYGKYIPKSMWYFLTCLICRSHSAGFWISFRQNCCMHNCSFNVFVEDEFKKLLCWHIEVKPQKHFFYELGELTFVFHSIIS